MKKFITLPNLIILIALPIITIGVYYFLQVGIKPPPEYIKELQIRVFWKFFLLFSVVYCIAFGGMVYGIALSKKHILFLISGIFVGWPILAIIFFLLLSGMLFNLNLGCRVEENILLIIAGMGFLGSVIIVVQNNLFARNLHKTQINIFSILAIVLNAAWLWLSLRFLQEAFMLYGD